MRLVLVQWKFWIRQSVCKDCSSLRSFLPKMDGLIALCRRHTRALLVIPTRNPNHQIYYPTCNTTVRIPPPSQAQALLFRLIIALHRINSTIMLPNRFSIVQATAAFQNLQLALNLLLVQRFMGAQIGVFHYFQSFRIRVPVE